MVYCTPTEIYDSTSLTITDVDETKLATLIGYATAELNSLINIEIEDEHVLYISLEKENEVNGTNTIFYTKKYPIGDYDNDGAVGTGDIIVYTIGNDGTRTTYTVSSINDDKIGKFTLSSAPSSNETLYISYMQSPVEVETPHPLVKRACIYLSTAFGYSKIDTDKYKTLKLGRLSVMKFESQFKTYMTRFYDIIDRINDTMSDMVEGKGFMD